MLFPIIIFLRLANARLLQIHACIHAYAGFESDQFHVGTAKTVAEACKLVEVGFEFVTEVDGNRIF